jgi:two-component system sensor histidine kinase KdpD
MFLPLGTAQGKVALLGVLPREQEGPLPPEQRRLLDALTDQVAVAIEKMLLVEQINEERVTAERERVRSAMLASVSHDLRTPLASIIGAISSLRSYDGYDEKAREELLATAQEEAERLNRFVGNLLDMTRLDAGAIAPRLEPVDVGDLVSTVLRRARPLMEQHGVTTSVALDLPPVQADFPLIEQVLFNLIDNAAKYAPAGTTIDVGASRDADMVEIRVRDEGPGIAEDALPHVFDKFFRAASGDRKRPGTGLGLAIARGFVEAQGGSIAAANRADRAGAEFRVRLKVAD